MGQKLLCFLNRYYFVDPRAAAILRMGVSLLVLLDLCFRFGDVSALYSEEGIWPSKILFNLGWQEGFWTIHSLFNPQFWVKGLFVVQFISAICLFLGFKSRFFTVLSLLLLISLHNRNVFVLQAGDDLLRLVLFWGCFLNWGQRWSLDAGKTKISNSPLETLAGFAYLLLLASVYLFTVILKNGDEWQSEGSAVYYALSLDQMRLPFTGDILYAHPMIMKFLTRLVYVVEFLLPFLILWPSQSGKQRMIAFLLILLLHLGIGLFLFVGLFFLISILAAAGLISPGFLDRLEKFFHSRANTIDRKEELKNSSAGWRQYPYILIMGFLIFLNLLENLKHMSWFPYQGTKELRFVVNSLRLNQYWGMFSPGIQRKDGWMVYHGLDALGRQWDLRLNQNYVDYEEPEPLVSTFKNDRWRKLSENMQREDFLFLRPLYAGYVLRKWNKEHPEKKLATLNLYFMERENLPDYRKTTPIKLLYAVSSQE